MDLRNIFDHRSSKHAAGPTQNGPYSGREEKEITALAKQESSYLRKVQEIDNRITRIQRSTKTLFPQFSPLHNFLRMKWKWYYNWHTLPWAKSIHWSILFVYLLALIVFIPMMFTSQPKPVNADAGVCTFAGGTGTVGDPYQISTLDCLQAMSNDLTASYQLVADIDASSTSSWNGGAGFLPIGTYIEPAYSSGTFTGNFDGQHYTISDLTIINSGTSNAGIAGLFGWVGGDYGWQTSVTIKDVNLVNVNVNSSIAGGLVGWSFGQLVLTGNSVSGTVVSNDGTAGGLIGNLDTDTADISNNSSTVTVSAGSYAGGLIGANTCSSSDITNNSASGNVSVGDGDSIYPGYVGAGGLIGQDWPASTYSGNFATGNVTGGDYTNVGGFIGEDHGSTFTNNYSTGDVEGGLTSGTPGGFAGYIEGSTFTNNYTKGQTVGAGAGGFYSYAGAAGTFTSNYWLDNNSLYDSGSGDIAGITVLAACTWGGGQDGTADHPYEVDTLGCLQAMGKDLSASYKLVTDIDAASTSGWYGGAGFEPIGYNTDNPFVGNFDGNGKIIDHLAIDYSTDISYNTAVGLFGHIGSSGGSTNTTIKNVGLSNVNINGGNHLTGGLAGNISDNTVISGNFVDGSVSGEYDTGGLTGDSTYSQISNNYVNASVTSSDGYHTGGLVGYDSSSDYTNNYSTSSVTGNINYIGGFIGLSSGSTFSSNYWLAIVGLADSGENYGVTDLIGVDVKSAAAMKQHYTFQGWTFPPTTDYIWTLDENNAYPQLAWQGGTDVGPDTFCPGTTGDGTPENPIIICNMNELQNMRMNLSASYKMGNASQGDISAQGVLDASVTSTWNPDPNNALVHYGFEPIGLYNLTGPDQTRVFSGNFDGDGKTINGLYEDLPEGSEARGGLFGFATGATIENISLTDIDFSAIRTGNEVGGLVGSGDTLNILKSYTTGTIKFGDIAGGLAARFGGGNIAESYSSVNILDSGLDAGGLVGYAAGISPTNTLNISRSYATGNINGLGYDGVGGLIGGDYGYLNVSDSYSTGAVSSSGTAGGFVGIAGNNSVYTNNYTIGAVSGSSTMGGFVGADWSSNTVTYTSCYFDHDINNLPSIGGLPDPIAGIAPKTTAQLKQHATFVDWDFPTTWTLKETATGGDYAYPMLAWEGGTDTYPGAGNSAPVNNSLTFTNPYSSNIAIADDTREWNFRALVTDDDGATDINYVELRLANSSDSAQPYDSIKLRWTEATDTFSEGADTQSAITLTSTNANSNATGNQWTLDFKFKINDSFLAKDTAYAAELYTIDDASGDDTDNYTSKYQVKSLSLSLDVDNDTISFGSLLPGFALTGTTIATVTTNYPNGYALSIQDNVSGSNSALLHTDTTTRVADYAGTIATPTLWSGSGLGVCLYSAAGKESKWGTGTTETDSNNKYAGIPQSTAQIHAKTGAPTSADQSKIGYKLVVPDSQKTGAYSGSITVTVTGVLN